MTPLLRSAKASSDHGRLQEINNAAASLRQSRKKLLPNGGGREGGDGRGGEGGWMTEWQLLRRGSSHLLKRASTFSSTQPRRAHARRGQRLTLASFWACFFFCFCAFGETSLRAPRPCPLRARRFCQNKANKARPAFSPKKKKKQINQRISAREYSG